MLIGNIILYALFSPFPSFSERSLTSPPFPASPPPLPSPLTEQPLSHPLAYKPYSPRIPKSDPPPIPLHSHSRSRSRPSTEAMLRRHESQPSQAQFHFGGESSTSPVETLSERGAGAGYGPYTAAGPDGPGGIVDMNGWNRQSHSLQQPQPQQQLKTQQTSITTKTPEIQSDRQRQEQGYTPQSNNSHLQGSMLAGSGGEGVEMVERTS